MRLWDLREGNAGDVSGELQVGGKPHSPTEKGVVLLKTGRAFSWPLAGGRTWAMSSISGHIGLVSNPCLEISKVTISQLAPTKEWEELLLHLFQPVPNVCWGKIQPCFPRSRCRHFPQRESQLKVMLDSTTGGLVEVISSWWRSTAGRRLESWGGIRIYLHWSSKLHFERPTMD